MNNFPFKLETATGYDTDCKMQGMYDFRTTGGGRTRQEAEANFDIALFAAKTLGGVIAMRLSDPDRNIIAIWDAENGLMTLD